MKSNRLRSKNDPRAMYSSGIGYGFRNVVGPHGPSFAKSPVYQGCGAVPGPALRPSFSSNFPADTPPCVA
jgi:hypothetical protein